MLCLFVFFDLISESDANQCLVDALTGPSGGGEDGSRTVSAHHDGADGEPAVESPETRKRKAPSTSGDDKYMLLLQISEIFL